MRKLISKLKTVLLSRKGETLVESIVSIVILTILLGSVSTILTISGRMIAVAMRDGAERQEQINDAVIKDYTTPNAELTLQSEFIVGGRLIDVKIDIDLVTPDPDGEGYVAWGVKPP